MKIVGKVADALGIEPAARAPTERAPQSELILKVRITFDIVEERDETLDGIARLSAEAGKGMT